MEAPRLSDHLVALHEGAEGEHAAVVGAAEARGPLDDAPVVRDLEPGEGMPVEVDIHYIGGICAEGRARRGVGHVGFGGAGTPPSLRRSTSVAEENYLILYRTFDEYMRSGP